LVKKIEAIIQESVARINTYLVCIVTQLPGLPVNGTSNTALLTENRELKTENVYLILTTIHYSLTTNQKG